MKFEVQSMFITSYLKTAHLQCLHKLSQGSVGSTCHYAQPHVAVTTLTFRIGWSTAVC